MGSRTPGAGLSGRAGALKRPFPLGRTFTTAAASEESFAADSFASELRFTEAELHAELRFTEAELQGLLEIKDTYRP